MRERKRLEYDRKRKLEYPKIEELVIVMWEKLIEKKTLDESGVKEIQAIREKIKTDYPKSEELRSTKKSARKKVRRRNGWNQLPDKNLSIIVYEDFGKPVVDINLDDDQIEDRVDDALQYFAEYHYDGIEKVYLKHQITQDDIDNSFIDLDRCWM